MRSILRALAIAVAVALAWTTTVAPANASTTDTTTTNVKQEGGGDVGAAKNSSTSERQIRMWKDDNCPNTLEGFKRSAVVYPGEWSPFPSVGSVWMAKNRRLKSSYWLQTWTSPNGPRCINLTVSPTTVLKYTVL
jgi:hypothetical protein